VRPPAGGASGGCPPGVGRRCRLHRFHGAAALLRRRRVGSSRRHRRPTPGSRCQRTRRGSPRRPDPVQVGRWAAGWRSEGQVVGGSGRRARPSVERGRPRAAHGPRCHHRRAVHGHRRRRSGGARSLPSLGGSSGGSRWRGWWWWSGRWVCGSRCGGRRGVGGSASRRVLWRGCRWRTGGRGCRCRWARRRCRAGRGRCRTRGRRPAAGGGAGVVQCEGGLGQPAGDLLGLAPDADDTVVVVDHQPQGGAVGVGQPACGVGGQPQLAAGHGGQQGRSLVGGEAQQGLDIEPHHIRGGVGVPPSSRGWWCTVR
jgi:hypothetical protein